MNMVFKFTLLGSEVVLKDDYPIHRRFVYIVDGIFRRSLADGTVKDWKEVCGVKEIRKCNLFGHEFAKLGDRVS